jgi:glycyl-tRNA synthetase
MADFETPKADTHPAIPTQDRLVMPKAYPEDEHSPAPEPQVEQRSGINSSLGRGNNLNAVVELCKRRGFVYPSSEIYGGFASTYDFGPLGALVIDNIKNIWKTQVAQKRRDVVLMDCAIMSHPKIWEASGHLSQFNDPLVEDLVNKTRYRADKLLEDSLGLDTSKMTAGDMQRAIIEHGLKSPDGNPLSEIKAFNLMVPCSIGAAENSRQTAYLRGETCQGIFVNYKNLVDTARVIIPFGVLQIGKSFRNEITTKQFLLRVREFEQMEFEFFFDPAGKEDWYHHWQDFFLNLLDREVGLPRSRFRMRELPKEEMSHYAMKQADFEFQMRNGDWLELSPMNHRGDWDLSRHSQFSKVTLNARRASDNSIFTPNVIETSFGVGRLFYTVMDNALTEEPVPGTNESRTVLKLTPAVAPYKIALLPLSKKPELVELSDRLYADIAGNFSVDFDVTGSIGKRYRRQDEIGTPICATIDFDSLQDQQVTLRDRDTMRQIRIPISQVRSYVQQVVDHRG